MRQVNATSSFTFFMGWWCDKWNQCRQAETWHQPGEFWQKLPPPEGNVWLRERAVECINANDPISFSDSKCCWSGQLLRNRLVTYVTNISHLCASGISVSEYVNCNCRWAQAKLHNPDLKKCSVLIRIWLILSIILYSSISAYMQLHVTMMNMMWHSMRGPGCIHSMMFPQHSLTGQKHDEYTTDTL